MRKRRAVWLALAPGFIFLVGACAVWIALPSSRVTQENFQLVRGQMTEREVATILGEGSEPKNPKETSRLFGGVGPGSYMKEWDGPDLRAIILFRADGRMHGCFETTKNPLPTLFRRLRAWLGW
jgi:hypothetical protein